MQKKKVLIKNSSKNKQTKLPPCLIDGHNNNYRHLEKKNNTVFNGRKLDLFRKAKKHIKQSRLAIN